MITLSKKEDVNKVSEAISVFIQKTGVIPTEFYKEILSIKPTLEKSKKEEDIEKAINLLNN